MNILCDKFSTGQVVTATGASNATLQSWLKRGVIVGHRDEAKIEGGGSPGKHRQFQFFTVMEIATAKALLDCGMSDVRAAFQAAMMYAHSGNGAGLPGEPARDPSHPFDTYSGPDNGYTLLCVSGETSHVVFWVPGTDPMAGILSAFGSANGGIILHMNPIFDRVTAALGYHPQQVLEAAYAGAQKH